MTCHRRFEGKTNMMCDYPIGRVHKSIFAFDEVVNS